MLAGIKQGDDIGVLQPADDACFLKQRFHVVCAGVQCFDGDLTVKTGILRQIHSTLCALAEFANNFETSNGLRHFRVYSPPSGASNRR